jgi:hypothetical protein
MGTVETRAKRRCGAGRPRVSGSRGGSSPHLRTDGGRRGVRLGGNDAGQSGDDNAGTDRDTAEVVVGGRTFVTLAAGSNHSVIRPWSAVMPLAGWALSRSRTGAPR